MAGTSRIILGALAFLLTGSGAANALDGYVLYWPAPTITYYAPAPVYSYYWAPPSYYPCPLPRTVRVVPINGFYAQPIPAPPSPRPDKKVMPSAQVENDGARDKPSIIATRSLQGSFIAGAKPLEKERCRVGFWNLTSRDVKLTIDGKSWTLPRNRSLTVDLERAFAWQIDNRGPQAERIPDGQSSHELFIRD